MSAPCISNCLLVRNQGISWTSGARVAAKGYLFDGQDAFLEQTSLLDFFSEAHTFNQLYTKISTANGCFAVVGKSGDLTYAAVDRLRSIPLFYATSGGELLISDDATAIRNLLAITETDPLAQQAFVHSGYTLEHETLYPEIRQLGAGDMLTWEHSTRRLSIQPYFRHVHHEANARTADDLLEELDELTVRFTRRLIASANGKTIVIPLSGGYDSRLILCGLKREGFTDAICYTYGRKGSLEAQIARRVARQLHYRHFEVCYSEKTWRELLDSTGFSDYCRFSANECSVPHFQDLPALQQLTRQKAIPADALIVPGFCGDVLGGSFVPIEVATGTGESLVQEGIDKYLFQKHFYLLGHQIEDWVRIALCDKIRRDTAATTIDSLAQFCSVTEDWFTRHKLAKFVVNALRVYEWLGYAWRMPLWDSQLMDWWYQIPLKHRSESKLYHRYLFDRLFLPMNVGFGKGITKRRFETALGRYISPQFVNKVVQAYLTYRPQTARANLNAFAELKKLLLRDFPAQPAGAERWHFNGAVAQWWLTRQGNSDFVSQGAIP